MRVENKKALEDELLGAGLDMSVAQGELRTLGNMYRALKRSWFWVAFVGLLGGAASYALSLGLEERYTSVAQVMIETRVNEDTQFTPFLSNLPISLTSLESELEVLRSLDLVERVVDRLQLQDDPEFFDPSGFEEELASPDAPGAANPSDFNLQREQTIANVADRREIEQVGNISAVYAIRFTTSDARKSAALANMLAEEYVSTTRNEKLRSLELSQGWLTQRVSQLQERLSDLGVQLEQNLLSAPYSPDEIETIKARNVATERRLNQFESEARDIDATIGRINGLLSQGRPVLAAATLEQPSSDIEDLLAAAKAGAEGADARLTEALRKEVERLLVQRAELDVESLPLGAELERTRAVLLDRARRDAETKRIENDIAVSEAIYQDFMTQLSRRTEQREYLDADARVISLARPPFRPSEPSRRAIAAGGFGAAIVIAAIVVLMRELFQDRMRNIHEFENSSGLPLIGVVPEVQAPLAPLTTFFGADKGIAPRLRPFVRKLRWSILAELPREKSGRHAWGDMAEDTGSRRDPRSKTSMSGAGDKATASRASSKVSATAAQSHIVIAGASANRGDGQSSAMLALAGAFVEGGERVLLIDCDFGRSPFSRILDKSDDAVEYTRLDALKARQFIVETDIEGLHVLSIPNSAAEAARKIGAAEWWRLFRSLASQYDRILLDTPPLMSGIDTAVLHQAADAVVLFARWNSTTRGETRSALKVLGDVGVTPIAVVASRIELERVRRYGDDILFYLGKSMSA